MVSPESSLYLLNGTPPFDSTARAISETAAGSCSGGEDCHLSIGFMDRELRTGAGVSGLGAISIGLLEVFDEACEEDALGNLARLRALANQFAIWVLFSPVRCCSISISSFVGYGRALWAVSQFLSILTTSLEKRPPAFGVGGAFAIISPGAVMSRRFCRLSPSFTACCWSSPGVDCPDRLRKGESKPSLSWRLFKPVKSGVALSDGKSNSAFHSASTVVSILLNRLYALTTSRDCRLLV